MAADYSQRQAQFGLADLDAVAAAAAQPATIFLDVRSESEVSGSPLPNGKPFVHCPVTMGDTSQLEAKAAELLPDKSATILCFCGVGGRVMGAKKVLDGLGYTNVMNVGGLKDLVAAGVV